MSQVRCTQASHRQHHLKAGWPLYAIFFSDKHISRLTQQNVEDLCDKN